MPVFSRFFGRFLHRQNKMHYGLHATQQMSDMQRLQKSFDVQRIQETQKVHKIQNEFQLFKRFYSDLDQEVKYIENLIHIVDQKLNTSQYHIPIHSLKFKKFLAHQLLRISEKYTELTNHLIFSLKSQFGILKTHLLEEEYENLIVFSHQKAENLKNYSDQILSQIKTYCKIYQFQQMSLPYTQAPHVQKLSHQQKKFAILNFSKINPPNFDEIMNRLKVCMSNIDQIEDRLAKFINKYEETQSLPPRQTPQFQHGQMPKRFPATPAIRLKSEPSPDEKRWMEVEEWIKENQIIDDFLSSLNITSSSSSTFPSVSSLSSGIDSPPSTPIPSPVSDSPITHTPYKTIGLDEFVSKLNRGMDPAKIFDP